MSITQTPTGPTGRCRDRPASMHRPRREPAIGVPVGPITAEQARRQHPARALRRDTSAARPLSRLVITRGHGRGATFSLAGRTVLGRHRKCDIVVDDPTVSRWHARIESCAEGLQVSDAGSLNGTFLNGHPLETITPLADGDEIQLGNCQLVFHVGPLSPPTLDVDGPPRGAVDIAAPL